MQPEAVRRRPDSLPDLAVQGKPVNGLFRLLASPLIWEMAYADIAPNKGQLRREPTGNRSTATPSSASARSSPA